MLSWFERAYQTEPVREEDYARESGCIEMSDAEHLRRLRPVISEENPMMPELLALADELTRKKDAKSKSKATKSKAKRANPKPNKAAVARVQEEL